jgi:DNA-binding winged helix-turn-helix (wHTH) protein
MLSARGEEVDRIVGLEVGADDYLPKPFSHRELLARVAAVLRRRQPAAASGRIRRFGPFEVDLEAHRLTRNGEEVDLSGAEFALLKVLIENPDRVLGRDALVELLKGYERAPFDRMVDVRVTRLRRKIEPDPAHPVYLRTVWGEGYLFSPGGARKNMMLPRTLFGRTTLVIALASFAFQLFTIAVITSFALVPLGRHATGDFAALLVETAQKWQARAGGRAALAAGAHRPPAPHPGPGAARRDARLPPAAALLSTCSRRRSRPASASTSASSPAPARTASRGTGPTSRWTAQRCASAFRPAASTCSPGSPCC